MSLKFAQDRCLKEELRREYPAAYRCLDQKGVLGGSDKSLRFVGVVNAGPDECVMFLPHGSPRDLANEGEAFAKEVMDAVAKFARQNSRTGEEERGDSTLSFSALVSAIAEDYRDYGLFSERLRNRSVNSGKPDWPSTIKSKASLFAANGMQIYSDIRTTRTISSNQNIVAIVQSAVVREIFEIHKWWLAESFGRREIPHYAEAPRWPREAWARILRGIRQSLFAERPLRLVAMLISYLEHTPEGSEGALVCGISDFATVWEAMLKKVLPNVEDGWNRRLPDPRYINIYGMALPSGGMKTDIVINDGELIIIADAKYYRAVDARTAPDWADIVKQFYYVEALATVQNAPTRDKIRNCFIFPIIDGDKGELQRIEMFDEKKRPLALFPPIDCIYVGTRNVINSYCMGTLIPQIFNYG